MSFVRISLLVLLAGLIVGSAESCLNDLVVSVTNAVLPGRKSVRLEHLVPHLRG